MTMDTAMDDEMDQARERSSSASALARPNDDLELDEAALASSQGSSARSSFMSSVSTAFMSTSAPSNMQTPHSSPGHADYDSRSCTTPPRFPDVMDSSILATDTTGGMPPGHCRAPIRQQQRARLMEPSVEDMDKQPGLCFTRSDWSESDGASERTRATV